MGADRGAVLRWRASVRSACPPARPSRADPQGGREPRLPQSGLSTPPSPCARPVASSAPPPRTTQTPDLRHSPLPSSPGRKKEELCFKNSGFFTLFTEVKFIRQSSLVSTFSPGAFRTFAGVYNHLLRLVPRRFPHPQRKLWTPQASTPCPTLLPPPASGPPRLLPASVDLPVLGPAGKGVPPDASFVPGSFPSAQHAGLTHVLPGSEQPSSSGPSNIPS